MRMKPLLPSLREKKRYIVFEVISDQQPDAQSVHQSILDACTDFIGQSGMAQAGVLFLADKYTGTKGIIRVTTKSVQPIRAALSLITEIRNAPAIVRSVGVSGILKKAQERFIAA